jgi:hypothetical protein
MGSVLMLLKTRLQDIVSEAGYAEYDMEVSRLKAAE